MTCRAETRDPKVGPSIPRSVDRALRRGPVRARVAPTEPSGRQWTRGGGPCTSKLNFRQRWSQDCSGSLRSTRSPAISRFRPWLEPARSHTSSRSASVKPRCIKASLQRPTHLSCKTKPDQHSHHVGPKSAVAAVAQQPEEYLTGRLCIRPEAELTAAPQQLS